MNKSKDSLGDRMKEYESCFNVKLPKKQDYILRVDGRHFHSVCNHMDKPFDHEFIEVMQNVAKDLLLEIQGAKIVYVQSDEISVFFNDKNSEETSAYFDNKLQKICSVVASFTTMKFNRYISKYFNNIYGMFDCRVFMLPEHDIPNYFVWRQKDWTKNSVQMLARHHYSTKELHRKKQEDMHDMLYEKGVNWANLDSHLKNGTFYVKKERELVKISNKVDYEYLKEIIEDIKNQTRKND